MSEYVPIARVEAVSEGARIPIVVSGQEMVLVRTGDNYFLIQRFCPHKAGPIEEGLLENGKIYCPMHGWGFDLNTGACDSHKSKKLRTLALRVENGEILAPLKF